MIYRFQNWKNLSPETEEVEDLGDSTSSQSHGESTSKMSENLGGFEMSSEIDEAEALVPAELNGVDKTSDHSGTTDSTDTTPSPESEPLQDTSPPEKKSWRAHQVFKQVSDLNNNIKQTAKDVVERITGQPSSSAFRMLSSNDAPSGKWIKELSAMANVVVGRCARILLLRPEELKENFEEEAPASAKDPSRYARNFLEYCCFRGLAVATQVSDHLRDKDFRRWTFDMMLAWEAPGAVSQPSGQMDAASSACLDAFARLAPGIPLAADSVTVHSLFEFLTEDASGRLSFEKYNKYLTELDRMVKHIKSLTSPAAASALGIARGEESVVDVDGGTPTQPVLQHVGVTAWPGRVTLTDHALYFEPSGVVSYDAAKKYDLTADLKQTVKPDLVGPWGAKIFDKAITFKSNAIQEPVVLEFSELTGHMRRDYWLSIMREIIAVHGFVRQHRLEGTPRRQAIAKAVRGIARLKTLWAMSKALPSQPEMHLTFLCADEMPGGDAILRAIAGNLKTGETLSSPQVAPKRDQLEVLGDLVRARPVPALEGGAAAGGAAATAAAAAAAAAAAPAVLSPPVGPSPKASPVVRGSTSAAAAVAALLPTGSLVTASAPKEANMPVGDVLVGEMTALERAIQSSRESSKKVAKAKKTVDEVKVEGMAPNVALFQELTLPMVVLGQWINSLARWEEPIKTVLFLACALYIIFKDWLCYVIPFLLICNAAIMIWMRFAQQLSGGRSLNGGRRRRNEIQVPAPPNKSAVEQILVIQQAIQQVESALQSVNIALLKMRALTMSELPQATDELIAAHLLLAVLLAVLPLRVVAVLVLLEVFTRNLEFRRESTERVLRRVREWWHRVPVVPVRFVEQNGSNDDLF